MCPDVAIKISGDKDDKSDSTDKTSGKAGGDD
jgi:hypothetical protein